MYRFYAEKIKKVMYVLKRECVSVYDNSRFDNYEILTFCLGAI